MTIYEFHSFNSWFFKLFFQRCYPACTTKFVAIHGTQKKRPQIVAVFFKILENKSIGTFTILEYHIDFYLGANKGSCCLFSKLVVNGLKFFNFLFCLS